MVSALAAGRLLSGVTDFIIPSHEGREPAVALLCEALSVRPVIRASLALGEGTGAVMMFALLDMHLAYTKDGQPSTISRYHSMRGTYR